MANGKIIKGGQRPIGHDGQRKKSDVISQEIKGAELDWIELGKKKLYDLVFSSTGEVYLD